MSQQITKDNTIMQNEAKFQYKSYLLPGGNPDGCPPMYQLNNHDGDSPIRIWLGSLHDYNNGYLNGAWLSLPMDEDQLMGAYNMATNNGEWDFIIADSEQNTRVMQIGEYDDPIEINDIAEQLEDMDDDDLAAIKFLLDHGICDDIDEALDRKDELYRYSDWREAVEETIELQVSGLQTGGARGSALRDPSNRIVSWLLSHIDYDSVWNEILHSSSCSNKHDEPVYIWYW